MKEEGKEVCKEREGNGRREKVKEQGRERGKDEGKRGYYGQRG